MEEQSGDGAKNIDSKEMNSKKTNSNDWTKLVDDLKKKVFNLRYQTESEDAGAVHKSK